MGCDWFCAGHSLADSPVTQERLSYRQWWIGWVTLLLSGWWLEWGRMLYDRKEEGRLSLDWKEPGKLNNRLSMH